MCVMEAAVLLEAHWDDMCDEVQADSIRCTADRRTTCNMQHICTMQHSTCNICTVQHATYALCNMDDMQHAHRATYLTAPATRSLHRRPTQRDTRNTCGFFRLCRQVWTVSTARPQARQRLMERNSLDEAAANARIDSQVPPRACCVSHVASGVLHDRCTLVCCMAGAHTASWCMLHVAWQF